MSNFLRSLLGRSKSNKKEPPSTPKRPLSLKARNTSQTSLAHEGWSDQGQSSATSTTQAPTVRASTGPSESSPKHLVNDILLLERSEAPTGVADPKTSSPAPQLDNDISVPLSRSNSIDGTIGSGMKPMRLSLSDLDSHLVDLPNEPPIASGGFCELYIAFHRPTGLKLAMKRPKFYPTPELQRRFRREGEIWSGFQHDNILPFFGIMEIGQQLHLISPWLRLGDLLNFAQNRLSYLDKGSPREGTLDETLYSVYHAFNETVIIREIAAGIEYLHSLNVVHGDIKARNVLLSDDGCAKICDFGLSKTLDHDATSTALQGVGTVRWQGPELHKGSTKSSKSDVYAFSMTITEILTANYPFPHLSLPFAIVMAVAAHNERPPFQPASRLGVDFRPLWQIAAQCWESDPDDRPTMKAVLQRMDLPPTEEVPQKGTESVEVPNSPSSIAFQRAVKKVTVVQQPGRTPSESTESPLNPRGRQHPVNPISNPKLTRGDSTEQYSTRPSRFQILQPALKKLTTTQYLVEHSGLVRSLQFSPDGKYLATGSWDRTAIIWKVGDPCEVYAKLLHPFGFVSQVAWSPEGKYLLTRVAKQIKVWTDSGLCIRTINRHHKVQALAWMPSGRAFICVEHSNIHVMDITGNIIDTHVLDRMIIHDAAVTPNEQRLLVVGTLEESAEGLKPSKSRAEKRIVVYDLGDKTIENQAPVLENVQDVTISQDGTLALVSYEDKAYPEVWRIDMVKGEGRLQLQSTYITPSPVDFAGPSYFGGSKEQFVICAGKAGDIYIWDRETGLLLHSLQASLPTPGDDSGDLTALGWNPYSPGRFMFSSATHDGTVRIWTAPAPPESEPPSRAGSPAPRSGGMSGSMGLAF